MNNFEKHIKDSAQGYSLSADEKARMQRVLKDYMQFKPVRGRSGSVVVSYSWISILHRPIAAALVLVLVFGSGVSYAAESALPGDALYTVKTYINEPTRVALATNAEAKANVQIELAERRIEEAAALSVEGRLDESTQEELAVAFESHAAAAAESIAKADEEDSSASTELASRFETRLVAHENILAEVEVDMGGDEENSSHRLSDAIHATNAILAEARFQRSNVALVNADAAAMVATTADTENATTAEAEPMAMTMSIATEAPANARSAKTKAVPEIEAAPAPDARTIARIKSAAEKSLKTVQKKLRSAKSLSADAKARADADIALADQFLADGNDFLEESENADAFAAFEESLRISEQASVFIKAAPTLEKARARNTRTNTHTEVNITPEATNTVIEISVPGAAADATITISTSSADEESDAGTSTDSDDTDDSTTTDDNEHAEDEPDSLIKSLIKFNISL